MNYIELPRPHGYLLWRGKQRSIASDAPLPVGSKVLVVSEGEAYGEVVLAQPTALNVSEFTRLEDEHCIRPEERKLYWPSSEVFYIHRLKTWQPFERAKMVNVQDGNATLLDTPELTPEQQALLEQAERLPKTVVLLDEAVTLEDGKAVIKDGLDVAKIEPVIKAVFDGLKSDDLLPLYQLALVRLPRLTIGQKKSEVMAMPYKVVKDHPGCKSDKPVGVINTETEKLKGCSENEAMAKEHMAALYAAENKMLKGEKCDMPMMEQPGGYVPWGVYTFADLKAAEMAQETAMENHELTQQFSQLANNIMSSPDIQDKPGALSALAAEYTTLIQQSIATGGEEMKQWKPVEGQEDESREDSKAVTKSEGGGDHPAGHYLIVEDPQKPTTWHLRVRDEAGKVDHRLMGAAWVALHGGYRGNKYEGPGKQEAITKLTALYKSENLDTPGAKGDGEVAEGEKVGRRMAGGMLAKLKSAYDVITELLGWATEPDEEDTMMGMMGKGIAIKQVNGKPWFIAYSTNAFEDREGEFFSLKSLEKYVAEAEKNGDRGTFNFWHIPGTDFAKKEWQAVAGRFLVEAGPFLDNDFGQSALKFFGEYPDSHPDIAPEGWGMSPEYRYLPEERKSGTYSNIWITRSSVLPRLAAANIWTKGTTMALSKEQELAAKTIFGETLAAQILKGAEDATKELEEAGVAHKSTEPNSDEIKPVELPLDTIVEEVAKRITPDFQPFIDGMTQLAEAVAALQGQVKSLEKQKAISEKTELPRYVFSLKRAAEDKSTIVADDDALKGMKPQEAKQDISGAAHFFGQRQ